MLQIQAFLADAEAEAGRLEPEERDRALAGIALARALIGEKDALGVLLAWKGSDER